VGGGTLHGAFEGTQGGRQSRERLYGRPGKVKKTEKTWTKIGDDGRAVKERHFKDSGNPKGHSIPHDHIITWDEKGNPQFSRPINYKKGKAPKFK